MLASVALRDLERLAAQVGAVQLKQVEGVEERDSLVAAAAQDVEAGEPAFIAAHHLPVDQARPHPEEVHGLDHEREAVQSLPRRVMSRMPTVSLRAISR